jgi:hypothetical protein
MNDNDPPVTCEESQQDPDGIQDSQTKDRLTESGEIPPLLGDTKSGSLGATSMLYELTN